VSWDEIDLRISTFMGRWGVLALRLSFGVIFIWFGILKPLGISSAEPLILATVPWLPFFPAETWVDQKKKKWGSCAATRIGDVDVCPTAPLWRASTSSRT